MDRLNWARFFFLLSLIVAFVAIRGSRAQRRRGQLPRDLS
jgi:hypothetical protein